MNQPSHTHPSPLLLQLQDQLLRSEQQYFEQLDQQAQQLERCNAQQVELTQAIKTLEAERQQWQAIFREAQEEQKALANALAEQRLEISLSDLQLRQAQEELATTLALQQELVQWQQKLEMSLQRQLNLMVKTLMLRCMDQLRWLLPMAPLRRFKVGIQRLLRR